MEFRISVLRAGVFRAQGQGFDRVVCSLVRFPRGSIYTTIMELGPQNHTGDGLLGANSIIVVYMDPLG